MRTQCNQYIRNKNVHILLIHYTSNIHSNIKSPSLHSYSTTKFHKPSSTLHLQKKLPHQWTINPATHNTHTHVESTTLETQLTRQLLRAPKRLAQRRWPSSRPPQPTERKLIIRASRVCFRMRARGGAAMEKTPEG